MGKLVKGCWAVLFLVGCLVSAVSALAADRTGEEILKELKANPLPTFDGTKREDSAYIKDYVAKQAEAAAKRAALVLELYKAAPDHERIPELMIERWNSLSRPAPKATTSKRKSTRSSPRRPARSSSSTEATSRRESN